MFAVIPKLSFNGHTWFRLHLHRQNKNRFWFLHVFWLLCYCWLLFSHKQEGTTFEGVFLHGAKQMEDVNLQWHPLGLTATCLLISICFGHLFALTSICFDILLLWHSFALTSHRFKIPFHGRMDFKTFSLDYRVFKRTRTMLQSAGSDLIPSNN